VVLREQLPNLCTGAINALTWLKNNPTEFREPEDLLTDRVSQVQKRLKPDEQLAVVEAYLSGLTVYEVGAQFGIHRTTVIAVMQRHGVKMRRTPRRHYHRQPPD
jgi:DNA-directed RNA polymerase specialized sigma24 family protein